MSPRQDTATRQAEIADAALRIIGVKGLSALTVATLAKECGLTGGALYRHFASTDAILEAVAVRASNLLLSSLPDPSLTPPAWLEAFLKSRSQTIANQPGLARLLFSDQLALAMPPAALRHLRGVVTSTSEALVGVVSQGQARGDFRKDIAALDLVPVVMGVAQMLALMGAGTIIPRMTDSARAWATLSTLLGPPAVTPARKR